jgi:hypothetical protein
LLDDRGWSSGAPIDGSTTQEVDATAKMVVGPDEPWHGQTREEVEESHWASLERKLQVAGVNIKDGELRTLSHDLEISDRLRSRLVQSHSS